MRLQLDTALSGPGSTTGTTATGAVGRSSAGKTADAGLSIDSASLSSTSILLAQVSAERGARLQQLTASVSNGSYDVPSAAISRALVDEALS